MKIRNAVRQAAGFAALTLFVAAPVLAADPAPAPSRTATPNVTAPVTASAKPQVGERTTGKQAASGQIKVAAAGSQQNRMKECNKQATGRKGDERRAFMKSCLSTRKS